MDLSIIIVSYNTKSLLLECIDSIIKFTKGIEYEIIVVDNNSEDGTIKALQNYQNKNLNLISSTRNLGFPKANNLGARTAKGRFLLFLNSDTKLSEDSLTKMVQWADENPKAGALTCTLRTQGKRIQANGGSFPTLLRLFMWATFLDDIPGVALLFGSYHASAVVPISKNIYDVVHQKDWISGAVFLIRREVIKQAGLFDEGIFMYGEDVEYCFRIKRADWQVWYTPTTEIFHVGSASGVGESVRFAGAALGKKGGIIGEVEGLKAFYRKYYPSWQYPILRIILKFASLLRIFIFGILGRQKEAEKIYAKAFTTV